jgi:hypothetical protein
MLADEQHVSDRAGLTRRYDALLQFPRFGVANQAQIND